MSLSDLVLLLRQDLTQTFRIRRVKGARSEKKHPLRRLLPLIIVIVVDAAIIWGLVTFGPLIWPFIEEFVPANLGFGATIFNALLLFGFLGSIMLSATTVGNSARMEYLMTMPISLRILFLEKTIIMILYSSILFLVIGTPIFLGLSLLSTAPLALLAAPVFIVMLLMLTTLGVSLGGLLGLGFSRILAGRRWLKQIGYALMTGLGMVVSILWYVSIWAGDGGAGIFDSIIDVAMSFGFGSDLTPGYGVSVLTLGLLVGVPLTIQNIITPLFFMIISGLLVWANAVVSEEAHYSGWLASGSKRSSKTEVAIEHEPWDPQPFPGFKLNYTTSVSMWYNIASVKRESRVFTQYLLGPIRFVIFLILPGFIFGDEIAVFTPFLLIAALIPFATTYGLYFAGYETVYEGSNLMNLQLAATNMQDYIKGKVYSALPFTLGAGIIMSVIILLIDFSLVFYVPAVVVSLIFVTMMSGAVSANAAAIGGDFKAQRNILRQRGAAVQMPIRGWSMLRAQMIPMAVGYSGVFGLVGAGMFLNPLFAYLILPVFAAVCYKLFQRYSFSAGIKLAQKEASDYM